MTTNVDIPLAWLLAASTENAEPFNIIARGNDWDYCPCPVISFNAMRKNWKKRSEFGISDKGPNGDIATKSNCVPGAPSCSSFTCRYKTIPGSGGWVKSRVSCLPTNWDPVEGETKCLDDNTTMNRCSCSYKSCPTVFDPGSVPDAENRIGQGSSII
jgi:hypothetical protein